MVYVFLADGFEEMEAIAPVDILRRLNIPVTTVGVTGKEVKGSHAVTVTADVTVYEADFSNLSALVLPGGMPGTTNLGNNQALCDLIVKSHNEGKLLAALCAAPSVFGRLGVLDNRDFTCYPGFEKGIKGNYKRLPLVISNQKSTVITAWGPGAAYRFGFALAEYIIKDSTKVEALKASMMMCDDE
ncbi:MAG: DJ-1/PfpI family protein [Clostridia bacterium]|nr:DJ-1/PfpI family protein [Clostridia bacterium]